MTKARATGLFIVAPTLVLAASILGALGATGEATRIVSVALALAAGVLMIWGTIYIRRLPQGR